MQAAPIHSPCEGRHPTGIGTHQLEQSLLGHAPGEGPQEIFARSLRPEPTDAIEIDYNFSARLGLVDEASHRRFEVRRVLEYAETDDFVEASIREWHFVD